MRMFSAECDALVIGRDTSKDGKWTFVRVQPMGFAPQKLVYETAKVPETLKDGTLVSVKFQFEQNGVDDRKDPTYSCRCNLSERPASGVTEPTRRAA